MMILIYNRVGWAEILSFRSVVPVSFFVPSSSSSVVVIVYEISLVVNHWALFGSGLSGLTRISIGPLSHTSIGQPDIDVVNITERIQRYDELDIGGASVMCVRNSASVSGLVSGGIAHFRGKIVHWNINRWTRYTLGQFAVGKFSPKSFSKQISTALRTRMSLVPR